MEGLRVEYPIDHVNFGIGIVTRYDGETDTAVVQDEDDGSFFKGPADKLVSIE